MSPHSKHKAKPLFGALVASALALGGLATNAFAATPVHDLIEKTAIEDYNLGVCIFNSYAEETGTPLEDALESLTREAYETELAKITHLFCNGDSNNYTSDTITTTAGIELLPNLESIVFTNINVESNIVGGPFYLFPKLEYLTIENYEDEARAINLWGNQNLTYLDVSRSNIDEIYIPASLERLIATSSSDPFAARDNVTERTLTINPDTSTGLKKSGDEVVLDIDTLSWLRASSTYEASGSHPWSGFLSPKSPTCAAVYSNEITLSSDCFEELLSVSSGINPIVVETGNTIDSQAYTNTFRINLNLTTVGSVATVDGEYNDAGPMSIDFLPIGESFDTDNLLTPELKQSISEGKYIIDSIEILGNKRRLSGVGPMTTITNFDEGSTDIRKLYTINDATYSTINVVFNLVTPTPKTPNTGFFTNKDGGASLSNIAVLFAGVSVVAFPILGISHRLSIKSRARKF